MSSDIDLPALLHQAQKQAAIEAVERYTTALTDEGPDKYLDIHHRLIEQLEELGSI